MNGNNCENKRVVIYDYLRLIATIFVVIGHSAYLVIPTSYGGVQYELPSTLNSVYYSWFLDKVRFLASWVYGFHMPLFFLLSGAVLALKPIKSFDDFIVSKIKRLLIPYFVYGWLFMLPVKYLGDFYTKDNLKLAMQGFLIGQDSGHLWFLTALFWCMLTFVLIQKLVSKFSDSRYAVLLCSGIIALLYTNIPFDVLGLKQGLSYIFWFALGYVFEKERAENKVWSNKKLIFVFVITLIIELIHIKYYLLSPFFVIIVGSFLTFLLSDLCSRFFIKWTERKVWKLLMRNLFYVYIFHDPLEYIVLKLTFSSKLLNSGIGCHFYTICRTIGVFFFSILLGEAVTNIKGLFSKAVFNNKKKEKFSKRIIIIITTLVLIGIIIGSVIYKYEKRNELFASNLTDVNWTSGILNSDKSVILFNNNSSNFSNLRNAEKIKCGKEEYIIKNIECDSVWIHVHVDRDAEMCAYPNKLKAEK